MFFLLQPLRNFNNLAVCSSIGTSTRAIDAVREHFDSKVKRWKGDLEKKSTTKVKARRRLTLQSDSMHAQGI